MSPERRNLLAEADELFGASARTKVLVAVLICETSHNERETITGQQIRNTTIRYFDNPPVENTIYGKLDELEEEGLLAVEKLDGSKNYRLTAETRYRIERTIEHLLEVIQNAGPCVKQ